MVHAGKLYPAAKSGPPSASWENQHCRASGRFSCHMVAKVARRSPVCLVSFGLAPTWSAVIRDMKILSRKQGMEEELIFCCQPFGLHSSCSLSLISVILRRSCGAKTTIPVIS